MSSSVKEQPPPPTHCEVGTVLRGWYHWSQSDYHALFQDAFRVTIDHHLPWLPSASNKIPPKTLLATADKGTYLCSTLRAQKIFYSEWRTMDDDFRQCESQTQKHESVFQVNHWLKPPNFHCKFSYTRNVNAFVSSCFTKETEKYSPSVI